MKIDYNTCIRLIDDIFKDDKDQVLLNHRNGYFLIEDVRYICFVELGLTNYAEYDDIVKAISYDERCKEMLHDGIINYIIKHGPKYFNRKNNHIAMCYNIAIITMDSDEVYKEAKSIVESRKYFEYRDASCCDTNISTYSKYGIVYVTDDCYCFDKDAIEFLASRCNISYEYLLKCIEFKSDRKYNVYSSVTITNQNTGKKYRRKVYRIEL